MTSDQPQNDDYRARIFADNIAVFELLIESIERLHVRAPQYSKIIGRQLSAQLEDLNARGKQITDRLLLTLEEEKEDRRQLHREKVRLDKQKIELEKQKLGLEEQKLDQQNRRFEQEVVEAAKVNRQRWFVLGQSLLVILIGDAMAIWIFVADPGAVRAASALALATVSNGGGILAILRAVAHGK